MKSRVRKEMTINQLHDAMQKGFFQVKKEFVQVREDIKTGNEELARMVARSFEAERKETDSQFELVGSDINGMKSDIGEMKGDIQNLKNGQQRIEHKIDNVVVHRWEFSNLEQRVFTLEKKRK